MKISKEEQNTDRYRRDLQNQPDHLAEHFGERYEDVLEASQLVPVMKNSDLLRREYLHFPMRVTEIPSLA